MSIVSPVQTIAKHTVQASRTEVAIHALVIIMVLICSTVLGLHGDFNSGDLLAIFTGAITGTATVAGARAGNSSRQRTTDTADVEVQP